MTEREEPSGRPAPGDELADLPRISADLPGIGGRLKDRPEHFVVEEIPLYHPEGAGPHLYLTVRRAGLTTAQMTEELAARFGGLAGEVGYAGLKDKQAVTTQTFSLLSDLGEDAVRSLARGASWELLSVSRHHNKLKVGHLLGNRFTLVLADPAGTLDQGLAIVRKIKEEGLPNYFGPQRFGRDGDNAAQGLALLKSGRRARSRREKFWLSALQSRLYNLYLARRIEAGRFKTVLTGEVCKKYQTGGLFVSEDGSVETARLAQGELTSAGPIFGAKMMKARGPAEEFENETLAAAGLSPKDMAGAGAGDRRANRLLLPDLALREADEGFELTFALPKGSYATTVMRELQGVSAGS